MIELLVVVSIIALLIAMLLPALGKSKEFARRTLCGSNQRQVGLGITTYALENRGNFFDNHRNYTSGSGYNLSWIRRQVYNAISKRLSYPPADYTGDVPYDPDRIDGPAHDIFYCPNRRHWERYNEVNSHHRIGMYIMVGHDEQVPFPWPGETNPWVSAGEITTRGAQYMTGDIVERGTLVPAGFTASHGPSGYFEQAATTAIGPTDTPTEGSNIGYLDGSVRWKAARELRQHTVVSNGGIVGWF